MTRKDFALIAASLQLAGGEQPTRGTTLTGAQHASLCGRMATALATTNPQFDRNRFLDACKPAWLIGTTQEARWERHAFYAS